MKGLKTLIKLQKKELDDRALKKATLEGQIHKLEENITQLQKELEKEQAHAASAPEITFFLLGYTESNKQRQQQLRQTITNIQRQVHALETEIQLYFGELKKYEIALEQKMKKQAREETLREGKRLDDIAMNKHVRKDGTA